MEENLISRITGENWLVRAKSTKKKVATLRGIHRFTCMQFYAKISVSIRYFWNWKKNNRKKNLTPWGKYIDLRCCSFMLKLASAYFTFEIEKKHSKKNSETLREIHWFTLLQFYAKISVSIRYFWNWKSECARLHARPWLVSIGSAIVSQHENQ